MAVQKQDDQLERTFSSYVRIQDVVLKTYLGRWKIGRSGERGSGISVLPARYDDDDDDDDDVMTVTLCLYCSPDVGVYSIGAFRGPPRSGVAFPTTSRLQPSGSLLATASGVSEVPLGRVWPSLPHLVSNPLGSVLATAWDPNSTELNNNSTPTRSPTGSLKSNV